MTTVKRGVLLFASGAVLLAQQQDVFFSTGAAGGMPGAMGAKTFAFVSGELVGSNPVKGAPYSGNAVTESTQSLADGNRIVNRITATVYRDGDGRERREQSLPNIGPFTAQGEPPKAVFISDPIAGANYSLNPDDKTAIKLPAPPMGALPTMPPGAHGEFNVMVQRIGVAGTATGVAGASVAVLM